MLVSSQPFALPYPLLSPMMLSSPNHRPVRMSYVMSMFLPFVWVFSVGPISQWVCVIGFQSHNSSVIFTVGMLSGISIVKDQGLWIVVVSFHIGLVYVSLLMVA